MYVCASEARENISIAEGLLILIVDKLHNISKRSVPYFD